MKTIKQPKFLLPKGEHSLEKWACIACDQHTSDISYWQNLEILVKGCASTLNLMLPEIFLHNADKLERLKNITAACDNCINNNIFAEHNGFVAIERHVTGGTRRGLLVEIDLEDYSYKADAKTLIRASEGTVLDRLPPRVEVRNSSKFDASHVLLLYSDKDFLVQKAIDASKKMALYNFDLNMNGGHIKGELISESDSENILNAFKKVVINNEMLFAVGDGNHSLAAAKQVYEAAKTANPKLAEKYRFAIAEAINIYDSSLNFEPIHRLVFSDSAEKNDEFLKELQKNMPKCPIKAVKFVDEFIAKSGNEVDYIHGSEHLEKLAKEKNAIAIELKPMQKSDFFAYILANGPLPKKTFSMGEAEDKRYYLELGKRY